jgi:hypothetical protein
MAVLAHQRQDLERERHRRLLGHNARDTLEGYRW